MGEFEGRVAIVTGGTRGIGEAIARRLVDEGAHVTVFARTVDRGQALEEEIERLTFLQADVASSREVNRAVGSVYEAHQRVDFLVNNAGITRDRLLMRMRDEDWQQVIDVNLGGAFNCIRASLRYMLRAKTGAIVNISSVIATMGNPGQTNYAASKAGLIGLTRSLAKEVAGRGIRVNAVAPGFIKTEMTVRLDPGVRSTYLSRIPLNREGIPTEVAAVVTFLLSERSSYITGQVVDINGGLYP